MNFIKRHLLLICSILAIVISGFFLYNSFVGYYIHPSEEIGRTTGKASAYAAIIFFAANFLRKRWKLKRIKFWLFCFALSFSLCATYDLIKTNIKVRQLNNSKQEIALLAKNFDTGSPQQLVNEYSKEQYGDFSNFIPILKILLNPLKIWPRK